LPGLDRALQLKQKSATVGNHERFEVAGVFTRIPRTQDTGGENPYIDTQDVQSLIVATRPSGCYHSWSALRVVKIGLKDCPTAKVLLELKTVALQLERY
jgi:hypothetical protein